MRIFENIRKFDFAPRQLKCNSGDSVGGGSSSYTGSSSSSLTSSILGAVSQTGALQTLNSPGFTNPVTPIAQAPVTSIAPASSSFSTILIVLVLAVLGYFAFTKL
jgi:hypothetical protein